MKIIDYELRTVQITCPNCKYEFPYNKNALQKKINQIGNDLNKLNSILKKINRLPKDKLNTEELKRLAQKKQYLEHSLSDYKLKRETLKEQEDRLVFANLKMALRELGGEELYKLCMDRALRDSKAYSINEMMFVRNNTHNDGGSLSKITK